MSSNASPFFSVIVPVYNVAPYLRECLDSVMAQTFSDWEAICVDDGSTDGSDVILDEYASKSCQIKVVHQKNAGVSAARNVALEIAGGEWVTFLDADDRIDAGRLDSLYNVINRCPMIDWIYETKYASKFKSYSIEDCDCELIRDGVLLAGWAILKRDALLWLNSYRREIISEVKFPVGVRYAEDDIFELRCLPYCRSAAVVGYCGYWYRIDRVDAASRRIDVQDSVKIHKLLLETAESQIKIFDGVEDRRRFCELFSQTVRKDFNRVFRKFWRYPWCVQSEHRAISRKIYCSPFFSAWYTDSCRFGYWIYMRTGFLLPMLIQDFAKRAASKISRILLQKA